MVVFVKTTKRKSILPADCNTSSRSVSALCVLIQNALHIQIPPVHKLVYLEYLPRVYRIPVPPRRAKLVISCSSTVSTCHSCAQSHGYTMPDTWLASHHRLQLQIKHRSCTDTDKVTHRRSDVKTPRIHIQTGIAFRNK